MALERTQPPSARFPPSIRAISRSATFTAIDSDSPVSVAGLAPLAPGRRENMSSLPQPAQISSSDSKGSFGPVFIVLGVIAVLAVIACVAGRLCARLMSEPKSGSRRRHHPRAVKDNDLEDGLEFDIPTLKPASKVASRDAQPADGGASKASVATKNAAGGVYKGATHPASSIQADKPSA